MPANNAQIRDNEALVYWVNLAGEIMLAPDTRMKPFVGWMRFEAKTASDIESVSRRMAEQEFKKFRSMKVEEHLRYRSKREELRNNCKLRLARGCISQTDEFATRMVLDSVERKDQMLYRMLTSEPDLSRGCLEIEKYEAPQIRAQSNGKRRGLLDDEVNLVGALVEGTR